MLRCKNIFLVFCFLVALKGYNQEDLSSVCRVEDGRIIFTLDLRWSNEHKLKISRQFSLDSTVMANAFSGKLAFTVQGNEWTVKKLNQNSVELSKNLVNAQPGRRITDDVIMVEDAWINFSDPVERQSVPYGINKFTRVEVFQFSNGTARFFLRGYKNAEEVYLSGSFNNWSTSQLPLVKSDSGWSVRLKLKPGKYSYKYIVDGTWMADPFNRQTEDDTYGGNNSVVFCFNYIFVLYGHQDAKNVLVSGSFNDWHEKELKMFRTRLGWIFPMYLREGMHTYKYIVDGQWMTDPSNKIKRPDGSGNFNSYIGIGENIYFRLNGFSKANRVIVAGNFNNWNTEELLMEQITGGWQLPYVLAPGNYEYKFSVDGKWITDPENPALTGSGDFANSVLAVKPNYTFVLDHYPDAETVFVSGSFNGWRTDGYKMDKKDGKWYLSVYLKPGKNLYKFIVDKTWIRDPDNELWENNEVGTGNSILWIKQ